MALPIAGFGNQEQPSIVHTLRELSRDKLIAEGRARIVIFGNRPPTERPDDIGEIIRSECVRLNIADRVDFVEGEIGFQMGRKESPLLDGTNDRQQNKPPMGLIRDLISITTMLKLRSLMTEQNNPIILQMDADFEGFRTGDLSAVLNHFRRNAAVDFLQCASDWESRTIPTAGDPLFKLGCDLMRELPMQIKDLAAAADRSINVVEQSLFGELIQRGVQVPQAERIKSIARKGGYGLLRLSDDELDANLRCAYRPHLANIDVANDVVFLWDSRRALAAWQNKVPPISQWKSAGFFDVDPVRTNFVRAQSGAGENTARECAQECRPLTDDMLTVINETLKRIPIPMNLRAACGLRGEEYICEGLRRCGIIIPDGIFLQRYENSNGTEMFQLVGFAQERRA